MNKKNTMGLIETENGKFVFRFHQNEFWAWNIYDNYSRAMTYKWKTLPKGFITWFDIDNPPKTVSFLPILD